MWKLGNNSSLLEKWRWGGGTGPAPGGQSVGNERRVDTNCDRAEKRTVERGGSEERAPATEN